MPNWVTPELTIDVVLALITLFTLRFTWKAANSSRLSAEVTNRQFILNKEQYNRELKPNLIPITNTYTKPNYRINSSLTAFYEINNDISDYVIKIINVGMGNAYSIEAFLDFENIEELLGASLLKNNQFYFDMTEERYSIALSQESINRLLLSHDNNYTQYGESDKINYYYPIETQIKYQTVLYSKNEIDINIESYVYVILNHYFYQLLNYDHNIVEPKLSMKLKYKAEYQLGTDEYIMESYALLISNVSKDNLRNSINFRLDFKKQ